MAKDSYWFKHDSNAGRDFKLLRICHIYTHWGKGIYWDIVEVLREQSTYTFQSDESSLQILCGMIGCTDFPKFKSWYLDCVKLGLFVENSGYFYSETLIKRMSFWEKQKANGGKSKGNTKPKHTQSIPKLKPKHNIIEYNIIEDKNISKQPEHPLQTYIKENLKNVSSLKTQLTYIECASLGAKYKWEQIQGILFDMENWSDLKKKTSVYLTANKWLKKELAK